MKQPVEFFSVADLGRGCDVFQLCDSDLSALLQESPYAPSLEGVRKFIAEIAGSGIDVPEKKFFGGLRALDSSGLLGFAQFRLIGVDADLDFIVVRADLRGQGLSKILLRHSLEEIHRMGAKRVLLEVGEGNLAAQSLYKHFGFETISIRKKYYKSGESALIMELHI